MFVALCILKDWCVGLGGLFGLMVPDSAIHFLKKRLKNELEFNSAEGNDIKSKKNRNRTYIPHSSASAFCDSA